MALYRKNLPQLSSDLFLTDGGVETTLIFRGGFELPEFASFDLLKSPEGYEAIKNYYRTYAVMAQKAGVGLILESVTWRANRDWGRKLGYDTKSLAEVNCKAIEILLEIRKEFEKLQMVISGCLGPRGDGYIPTDIMTEDEALSYHLEQIETLRDTEADLVSAFTINYVQEAIGITHAAKLVKMPVVISFTVETDGNLPTGQTLKEAIEQVDLITENYPAYYMINCAHPTHFADVLKENEPWSERLRGIRANASRMSHAELNEALELDDGNPEELARQYRELLSRLKQVNVLGGCCGTDHRHVEAIVKTCISLF